MKSIILTSIIIFLSLGSARAQDSGWRFGPNRTYGIYLADSTGEIYAVREAGKAVEIKCDSTVAIRKMFDYIVSQSERMAALQRENIALKERMREAGLTR